MLENIPANVMIIVSTVIALGMGILVTTVRAKSAKKPASAKKILLPPLFMSTGALMFVFPFFRVTLAQIGDLSPFINWNVIFHRTHLDI